MDDLLKIGLFANGGRRSADSVRSLIATTVRVAAVREMAREPERRLEILARISRIRTTEDAAVYIKEVDAKLKASRAPVRPIDGGRTRTV